MRVGSRKSLVSTCCRISRRPARSPVRRGRSTPWTLGDDGVLDVDAVWGGEWGAWGALRAEVFSLLGSVAEPTSHIRQRMFEGRLEFEMATGTLSEGSPFAAHGHLIRLRVRPA